MMRTHSGIWPGPLVRLHVQPLPFNALAGSPPVGIDSTTHFSYSLWCMPLPPVHSAPKLSCGQFTWQVLLGALA